MLHKTFTFFSKNLLVYTIPLNINLIEFSEVILMKQKGWFIPIIVFFISIIFLFFYQQKQDVVSFADTTDLPPITWSKNSTDIMKVTYEAAGKVMETVRNENDWILSTSNNRKADPLYIYNVITPFIEPLFEQIIAISPSNLESYGIDGMASSITLYDVEGNDYKVIKGNAFDEKSDYVYVPLTDSVYTMSNTAFGSISTNPNDWTSKDLVNFELDDLSKIDLVYKGHAATLVAVSTQHGISLTSNELDDRLANEFMNFLQTAKIQSFITEEATDHVLTVYGFHSPLLKCTIHLKTGETFSLTIGDVNEKEGICYTQMNDSPEIVTIPYFNLSQFNILYSELHDKDHDELG